MKRIFTLLLIVLMTLACCVSCVENVDPPDTSKDPQTSKQSDLIDSQRPINLTPMSNKIKYTPVSKSVETITEDECELLALDVYADVMSILSEFYGFPEYLGFDAEPHSDEELPYGKVVILSRDKRNSSIAFENDADKLRDILDDYFTDDFEELAFSLKSPCPIYEEDGVLYRTITDTGNGMRGVDLGAGRIISRENGVVRYAFPIYFLEFDTNEPEEDYKRIGYMDFAYEDGKWKLDDCRVTDTTISVLHYPGGKDIIEKDVLENLQDDLTTDGITVSLNKNDEAEIAFNGKTANLEIKNATNKIRKIEKANGNIFVSFLGVFGKLETVVVSESSLETVAVFVSDGYEITENGWNYVVVDRANQEYLIKDNNGNLLGKCEAVKQEAADYFSLPRIASVYSFTVTDEKCEIVYDTIVY